MIAKPQRPLAQVELKPSTTVSRRGRADVLRRWVARDGLALVVFLLATMLTMLPVLPHMRSRTLGGPGDNHLYTYMIGWMGQALVLGDSPFVDPRTNFPDGLVLSANDEPYVFMIMLSPVTLALGPTFTYNLIMFAGALLTGYICFLWIRRISGSWAGGMFAGLALLLAPGRLVHEFGHLALMCTFTVPLFFWALDSTLSKPRPTLRTLLWLGAATFIMGATSQYMLILCLVCGAIYTLLTILPRLKDLVLQGWKVAVSVVVGAGLSLMPDLINAERQMYLPYNPADIRHWAADPMNFLLPSVLHPLWGTIVQDLRPEPYWGEKTLYLGVVTIVLAVVALWAKGTPAKRRLWVWFGVATCAAVFALGTDLHINNQAVQPVNPVPLPATFLARLPYMDVIRVWPRFGLITGFFFVCLAGVGVAHLSRRYPRWPVIGIAGLLLLIDILPGMPITTLMVPRPVEQWLAQQPGDFAVAFMPPIAPGEDAYNTEALFGSLFHAKQLPAFNHPFHRSPAYHDFEDAAEGFPSQESVALLRELGLRYLLLERARFNGVTAPAWATVQAQLPHLSGLQVVTEQGDVVVVELK